MGLRNIQLDDLEYKEFQQWLLAKKVSALRQVETLEEDIDTPIKRCVALLALLGCEPYWSCCGFDYVGQAMYKSHQNTCSWVVLKDNERTNLFITSEKLKDLVFSEYANCWGVRKKVHYGDHLVDLVSDIRTGNSWNSPSMIHFSEPAAIAIGVLEGYLVSLQPHFFKEVVIQDTNKIFKDRFSNWQYPVKTDWIVRRKEWV